MNNGDRLVTVIIAKILWVVNRDDKCCVKTFSELPNNNFNEQIKNNIILLLIKNEYIEIIGMV